MPHLFNQIEHILRANHPQTIMQEVVEAVRSRALPRAAPHLVVNWFSKLTAHYRAKGLDTPAWSLNPFFH